MEKSGEKKSSRSEANYGSRPSLNGLPGARMTAIIGHTLISILMMLALWVKKVFSGTPFKLYP